MIFDALQDDWEAYSKFTAEVGKDTQIVGDDLLVTNPKRVQKGIDCGACNALLLKVNQIGSVTEAIEAATMAREKGREACFSGRVWRILLHVFFLVCLNTLDMVRGMICVANDRCFLKRFFYNIVVLHVS